MLSIVSIDQFNLQETNRLILFIFWMVDGGLRIIVNALPFMGLVTVAVIVQSAVDHVGLGPTCHLKAFLENALN